MHLVMKIKYLHVAEHFWTGTALTYKTISTFTKKNPQPWLSDSVWPKLNKTSK